MKNKLNASAAKIVKNILIGARHVVWGVVATAALIGAGSILKSIDFTLRKDRFKPECKEMLADLQAQNGGADIPEELFIYDCTTEKYAEARQESMENFEFGMKSIGFGGLVALFVLSTYRKEGVTASQSEESNIPRDRRFEV